MKLKLLDINEVTLETKDKLCKENISLVVDNTNIAPENIKSGVSILGINGTYVGSGSGGDSSDSLMDQFIEKRLTTYTNNNVSEIFKYAFAFTPIQSVTFENCTILRSSAFCSCTSLQSISIPKCSFVGDRAFSSCNSLQSIGLPRCTYIDTRAFDGCSRLSQISIPLCSGIMSYAFLLCSSLRGVDLPECLFLSDGAFANCYKMSYINAPKCSIIHSWCFQTCRALSSVYLLGSSVCSLANSNAFTYTGITQSSGTIYVPSSLYSRYKTATNWAYFSSRFSSYKG